MCTLNPAKQTCPAKTRQIFFCRILLALGTIRQNILLSQKVALAHPEMSRLLREQDEMEAESGKRRFDAVVVPGLFNEAGYFLAQRCDVSLAIASPLSNNANIGFIYYTLDSAPPSSCSCPRWPTRC